MLDMSDLTDKLAGEVIRQARQARGYTYRKVEELSAALEREDSQRFAKVSKTVLWNMETGGESFFLKRTVSPAKLRSVIELLFLGDRERFTRETGIDVLDVITDPVDDRLGLEVPMHLEMESASSSRRSVRAPVSCDFVLEVRTSRMTPYLSSGQPLYCIRAHSAQPGEIVILNSADEGLVVATALAANRYRYERTQREFALLDGAQVYGVVAWVKPAILV